jgi:hypothetical protein
VFHSSAHKSPLPVPVQSKIIQSKPSHQSSLRSVLIFSFFLIHMFFKQSVSYKFRHQNTIFFCHLPHTCHMPSLSHSPVFDHLNNIWWGVKIMKLLIMKFPPVSYNFLPFQVQVTFSAPYSETALACSHHSVLETKCQILTKQQAAL